MENGNLKIENEASPVTTKRSIIFNSQSSILNFPTAYAPNTAYISAIAHSEQVYIDVTEPYVRQTFRNHCKILTSQGVKKLSIPVEKKSTQSGRIKDTKIDYAEPWQRRHWRTLQAAYNNSPYFLYYQDELQVFYSKPYTFLVDFNTDILKFMLEKLRMENGKWRMENVARAFSHEAQPNCQFQRYLQVFNPEKFVPNLSSFDLLFNCGPESKSYLCKA